MIDPFEALDVQPRWMAWREEVRGSARALPTKVPYDPNASGSSFGYGSPTDPATWGAHDAAEGRVRQLDDGRKVGCGIVLGDLGDKTHLAGVDLDSSLDDNDSLAPWAAGIVDVLQTYTEVSPSGRGLKAFFRIALEDVRWFLDLIGVEQDAWGCKRGIPGLDGANHGPAVEVYTAARYFTATRRIWSIDHPDIVTLDHGQLAALAELIPSPAGGIAAPTGDNSPRKPGAVPRPSKGKDTSRSGKALGAALALAPDTYEEMVKGLCEHPDADIQAWVEDKGKAYNERELKRLWGRFVEARAAARAAGLADLEARIGAATPGARSEPARRSVSLADRVGDIVRHLEAEGKLGERTVGFDKPDEARFGPNGVLSIMLAGPRQGRWFDNKEVRGGGPVTLIQEVGGHAKDEAFDNWVLVYLNLYHHGGEFSDDPADIRKGWTRKDRAAADSINASYCREREMHERERRDARRRGDNGERSADPASRLRASECLMREPEAPRGNGHDPAAEEGSADPSVDAETPGDRQDRAAQAQYHWGSAAPVLSFRDPWAEPPRPQWPADVLPVKYHDMLFELAYGSGVDPGAQGMAALSSVSGAAPKNARFFPYGTAERWTVPPIIWAMIIAPSGQRKTALNSVFEALQRKHSLLWREYHAELRVWRALSFQERNKTPKPREPHSFLVTDTTAEKVQRLLAETDRGSLLLRDELAGFFGFGRYGNDKAKGAAERAFYLESYDGGSYTVHRVTSDSFLIEVNGLTVFGHIQPDRLKDFPDLQNDGLLQRFITIRAAQATVGRPLGTITGKSEFDTTIGLLAEMRPNSARPYRTTQESSDIIRRMEVDGIEFATLTDYGPGFSGFCGKLHGTLARLALILHLLAAPDREQTLISPDTVLAAERLVREFVLPHSRDFYATLTPDRGDLTRDIAGWLLTSAPARIRASDFGQHIWACRGLAGDALNIALDPLVTGGWLEPVTPFPTNRKWHLHSQVRAVLAHRVEVAAAQREANRQLVERLGRKGDEK